MQKLRTVVLFSANLRLLRWRTLRCAHCCVLSFSQCAPRAHSISPCLSRRPASSLSTQQEQIETKVRQLLDEVFTKNELAQLTQKSAAEKNETKQKLTGFRYKLAQISERCITEMEGRSNEKFNDAQFRQLCRSFWPVLDVELVRSEHWKYVNTNAVARSWPHIMMQLLCGSSASDFTNSNSQADVGHLVQNNDQLTAGKSNATRRLILTETLYEFTLNAQKMHWILKCSYAFAIAKYDQGDKRDEKVLALFEEVRAEVGNMKIDAASARLLSAALARTKHWRLVSTLSPQSPADKKPTSTDSDRKSAENLTNHSVQPDDVTSKNSRSDSFSESSAILDFFEAALRNGEYETALNHVSSIKPLLLEKSIQGMNGVQVVSQFILSLVNLMLNLDFGKLPKAKEKAEQLTLLTRLLQLFSDVRIYTDEASAKNLARKVSDRYGALVKYQSGSTLVDSHSQQPGVTCATCNSSLPRYEIDADRFDRLRSTFMQKVLIRGDIYLRTNPFEFSTSMRFFEHNEPFAYVVDGMNMLISVSRRSAEQLNAEANAHQHGRQNNWHPAPWSEQNFDQLLLQLVQAHADKRAASSQRAGWKFPVDSIAGRRKQGDRDDWEPLRILLVAHKRFKAMQTLASITKRWNRNRSAHAVGNLLPSLQLLTLNVATMDDCYSMYAAMHGGNDSYFVTNDFLADHVHRLAGLDAFQDFNDWLGARRVTVKRLRQKDNSVSYNVNIPDNGISSIAVNKTPNRVIVHVPYYRSYRYLPPQRFWLCMTFTR